MSILGKNINRAIALFVVCNTMLFAANVKVRLSSTEVVEGSSLTVQIVAEGKNIEFPDIRDIGGFPIEGSSISAKLESSYINGKFSSKNLKTLRFDFYPETDMTIPPFTVKIDGKEYKTNPIEIRTVKASEAISKSSSGYTMTIVSNKKKVYVSEPFIVTVKFFEPRDSSVSKIEYTPPKFKDFFSQALGNEKLKRSSKGTTHELKYLLSAKKEGRLILSPPKARVGIRSLSGADRDPWGFFANDIKWHSIRAKPLTIKAKPLPAGIDLVGVFKVESKLDKKIVKANTPVSYTLEISGEGILDDMEDPKFDIPGVTVYSDDAKIESKVVRDSVVSRYIKKYVFISDSDFTIPKLSFKSFDYLSKDTKILKTDEVKIAVDSITTQPIAKSIPNRGPSQAKMDKHKQSSDSNASILEDTDYYKEIEDKSRIGYPLWSLFLSFFAGVISLLMGAKLARYLKYREVTLKSRNYSTEEALQILYPHTNESAKIETMVRKLYEIQNGNKSININKAELAKMIERVTS